MRSATGKPVLAVVADAAFLDRALAVLSGACSRGHWQGEYALVTDAGTPAKRIGGLLDRGIHVLRLRSERSPHYLKLGLTHEMFLRWPRMLYLDCDVCVLRPLARLDTLDAYAYADPEPYPALWHFESRVPRLYEEASRLLPQHLPGFNSGALWLNTRQLCGPAMHRWAIRLRSHFQAINRHGGLEGGGDQPILNILLAGRWRPFPSGEIQYWEREAGPETLAFHFCHWMAPWINDVHCDLLGASFRAVFEDDAARFHERFPPGGTARCVDLV